MTAVTAPSHAPILSRSRRRIAIWALALMTLGGAAAGTAVTVAVSHNGSSSGKAVPTDSSDSYHYKRGPGPQ